jgi:1,4-alpha-glucan branching enzyme
MRNLDGGPCNDTAGERAAAAAPLPDKRLVFIGYEWRSSVEWSLFPDAPWEHGFDDQAGEIREGTLRHEREQQQDQQHALAKLQSNEAHAASRRDTTNQGTDFDTPAPPSQTSTD